MTSCAARRELYICFEPLVRLTRYLSKRFGDSGWIVGYPEAGRKRRYIPLLPVDS